MTPDPDAVDVDEPMAPRQLTHSRDLIRQRIVTHSTVISVGKCLGPPRRSHSVDLHDHESQLGQRLVVAPRGRKAARSDAARLRPRVNAIDDWVLPRRVEHGGRIHETVDVGASVSRLHPDGHGWLPPGCTETRDVGALDRLQDLSVAVAEYSHWRRIRSRIAVDEEFPVG